MSLVFPAIETPTVPIKGSDDRLPVRRIFCVGRNYGKHVIEMGGHPDRNPPFFFMKPADALVQNGETVPYPTITENFHFEIELVVAIGKTMFKVSKEEANDYIYGYAVGIDSLTGEVVYTTESHELDNDTISERRGYHVVKLHDLDGDGVSDFLMTASGQDRKNAFFDYEGRIYIHSGSDGTLISIVEGALSGDQLGTYATTIDDIDGDGYLQIFSETSWQHGVARH